MRTFVRVAFIVNSILWLAPIARGQSRGNAGTVQGSVIDQTGAAIGKISDERRENRDVEKEAEHRADHRSSEATRSRPHSGGDGARSRSVAAHDLCLESEVRGMDVSQAQEAKQLRDENTRLRKLVADLSLDKDALQWVIEKNGWSSRS
jgi:putative transposase